MISAALGITRPVTAVPLPTAVVLSPVPRRRPSGPCRAPGGAELPRAFDTLPRPGAGPGPGQPCIRAASTAMSSSGTGGFTADSTRSTSPSRLADGCCRPIRVSLASETSMSSVRRSTRPSV